MRPRVHALVALIVAVMASGQTPVTSIRPVLLTGEVVAIDSQQILVPPSNSAPVLIRNFVPEGTIVKKGDLLLRIEAKETGNINQSESEYTQAKARADRETSDLIVKALDAEKALLNAEAALGKAVVDAALPRSQVSALDFDRYQGELARSQRDLELKKKALANARDAVDRRRGDGELELKKSLLNIAYLKALIVESEVRATRDGVVVHGYSEWRGERCDEGSSAFPGNSAGEVIGSGRAYVRAWALEADRPFLAEGGAVRLSFDAIPGAGIVARISRIASAPEVRPKWGSGRYFRIDINLSDDHGLQLIPGMSVLVEPNADLKALKVAAPVVQKELTLEGEIASKRTTPVAPPEVSDVWQFNLAQLAPEGSLVNAGDSIAVFEAQELARRLDSKKSTLNEKRRALEKMKLDHGEAAQAADLAVSEAQSNAEKAQRKATVPKDQIRRVEYDKLVVDAELNAKLAALAIRQREAQAQARTSEREALDLEIKQLRAEIVELTRGQQALNVVAKSPGLVLYRTQFNGEKFAVGNQVWMGIAIATLADPEQLIVNATVPEAQSAAVRIGQRAKVNIPGANVAVDAQVMALGRTFHGKSRTQPIVVRDVELKFDVIPKNVKPGAAVQVKLLAAPEERVTSEPARATP